MKSAATTIEVTAGRIDSVTLALDGLIRRATKLGVAVPSYRVGGSRVVTRCGEGGRDVKVMITEVVVTGGRVELPGGWKFIATLEHGEKANVVNRSHCDIEVPVAYRTVGPACDHCHQNRKRIETHVIVNAAGTFMQVGTSCVHDFLGIDPAALAWACAFARVCNGDLDDFEGMGEVDPRSRVYDLLTVVAMTIRSVRAFGWHKSQEDRSTRNDVLAIIDWTTKCPGPQPAPASDEETKAAEEALAWCRNSTDDSEFMHNLRTLVSRDYVEPRHLGIVAALWPCYERTLARKVEGANSKYFGTLGKRDQFVLTVDKIIDLDGVYGTTHMHIMHDAAGNVAVWKSSSARLDVGTTYDVKGTVKSHQVYKDVLQTTLSRCACVARKQAA